MPQVQRLMGNDGLVVGGGDGANNNNNTNESPHVVRTGKKEQEQQQQAARSQIFRLIAFFVLVVLLSIVMTVSFLHKTKKTQAVPVPMPTLSPTTIPMSPTATQEEEAKIQCIQTLMEPPISGLLK
jgi:hypothetical protein